jgi:hypothetical protein
MTTLTPCPLCGATMGYTLAEGSTYRWWRMSCKACGDDLGECAADRTHKSGADFPDRWPAANEHWNRVGAYASGLVAEVARLAAERVRIAAAIREAWHQREASYGNCAGQYHEGVLAGLDAAVALALGPTNLAINAAPPAASGSSAPDATEAPR